MTQPGLFPYTSSMRRPVNVASVPQRSPFRYPGGKTWLVPWARAWMSSRPRTPTYFIEPFAGGGIVGLTAAFEQLVRKVIMVEIDDDVASVWQTILGNGGQWLARRILEFRFCADTVAKELGTKPSTTRERAFQTILKNRVYHGGILAPGSGLIRNGENGRGLASRWYPETLASRIRAIESVKDRIHFMHADGIEIMQAYSEYSSAVFFIDPPYTAAGKRAGARLYRHSELDHRSLFRLTSKLKGDVLMTYDSAVDVAELAICQGFDIEPVPMKNTHHAEMTELLIGRDLSWARAM